MLILNTILIMGYYPAFLSNVATMMNGILVTLLLLMFQQDCFELKEKKKEKKTACQTDLFSRKARIVQILQGLFIFIRGEVRGGEERQIPLKLILALLQIVSFNQTYNPSAPFSSSPLNQIRRFCFGQIKGQKGAPL